MKGGDIFEQKTNRRPYYFGAQRGADNRGKGY